MDKQSLNDDCSHVWISNSGKGGHPEFRQNRQMSSEALMHVLCEECGARTWFTKDQWDNLIE